MIIIWHASFLPFGTFHGSYADSMMKHGHKAYVWSVDVQVTKKYGCQYFWMDKMTMLMWPVSVPPPYWNILKALVFLDPSSPVTLPCPHSNAIITVLCLVNRCFEFIDSRVLPLKWHVSPSSSSIGHYCTDNESALIHEYLYVQLRFHVAYDSICSCKLLIEWIGAKWLSCMLSVSRVSAHYPLSSSRFCSSFHEPVALLWSLTLHKFLFFFPANHYHGVVSFCPFSRWSEDRETLDGLWSAASVWCKCLLPFGFWGVRRHWCVPCRVCPSRLYVFLRIEAQEFDCLA